MVKWGELGRRCRCLLSRVSFSWTVSCWIGGDDVEADGRGGVVMSVLGRAREGGGLRKSAGLSRANACPTETADGPEGEGGEGSKLYSETKGTLQRQEEPEFVSRLRQGC